MNDLEWTGERLVTSLEGDYFIYEHLHRYAIAQKLAAGKTVLDIACGEGYGSHLISKTAAQVYGVDIDANSVAHAEKKYGPLRNNLSYKVGSTSKIPLEDKSIDLVVSFETIEHHDEHEQMMLEIKRVLKKDGILLISSPNKPIYNIIVPNNPFHVKELTLDEFKTLLTTHFTYTGIYEQRFVVGSLITPIHQTPSTFETYEGNYEQITNIITGESYYNKPYYFMAVCSDASLDNVNMVSIFNGVAVLPKQQKYAYNKGRNEVTSSTSYKLGNWFVSRLSFLKKRKTSANKR